VQTAERRRHYYLGGFALCRADYDEDGTITITWSKRHVTCKACRDLLGSNGKLGKDKEGKT